MNKLFFDSWESILRTLIITIAAYFLLITLLRAYGKRTMSKMNAFDMIITIALGSTLATVALNKDVALADGALAFFLLIFLQFMLTYISARSKKFSNVLKSTPTLLVYRGKILSDAIIQQRIAEDEIHAIVREKGFSNVNEVDAVVLETDGSMTVIKNVPDFSSSTMEHIQYPK